MEQVDIAEVSGVSGTVEHLVQLVARGVGQPQRRHVVVGLTD